MKNIDKKRREIEQKHWNKAINLLTATKCFDIQGGVEIPNGVIEVVANLLTDKGIELNEGKVIEIGTQFLLKRPNTKGEYKQVCIVLFREIAKVICQAYNKGELI